MNFLTAIWFIGILGFGLLQISATIAGLEYWFGGYAVIAIFIGLFVGGIPFIGGIAGMVGAVHVWHWSWMGAILLFFGVPIIGLTIAGIAGGAELLKDKFSNRS